MYQLVIWMLFLVPWVSLLFLDRSTIRRYLPVALLTTVFNTIINQIAWYYNWWQYKPLFSWDRVIPIYMVYGIFLVGTIWIFRFTFRKFWLYFVVNLVIDYFGFGMLTKFLNTLGVHKQGNLSQWQDLIIMTIQAIILYGYQMWSEGILVNRNGKDNTEYKKQFDIGFRFKRKAR